MYILLSEKDLETYKDVAENFGDFLLKLKCLLVYRQTPITQEEICLECSQSETHNNWTLGFQDEVNSLGEPFGNSVCVSVNNCVAHGKNKAIIYPGDSVTVDMGVSIPLGDSNRRLYFDSAISCVLGSKEMPLEMQKTLAALKAIGKYQTRLLRPRDLSEIIFKTLSSKDLSVVTSLSGHLIGYQMHMLPGVPNAVYSGHGYEVIPAGALINPEPMAAYCTDKLSVCPTWLDSDGWSVMTPYRSSHWETTFYYDGHSLHDIVGITGEENESNRSQDHKEV